MWTGTQREHSVFSRRIIYKVLRKKPIPGGILSSVEYELIPAFDIENPLGTVIGSTHTTWDRDLKKLSLIDLGIMRMYFDFFVKEWARQQGSPVEFDQSE